MMSGKLFRVVAGCVGVVLVCGVGGLAWAEDGVLVEDSEVTLTLSVADLGGALTLSVADDEVALAEDPGEAAAGQRAFTGTLPVVTVYDTRDAADIDPDVYWYVVGQVTDFTDAATAGVLPAIPAANLGWAP